MALARGHAAADLHAAAADLLADDRRRDRLRALPFSTSTIAMRLPTFSRVTSLKMRAPGPSRLHVHGGLVGALVEARLRVVDAVAGQRRPAAAPAAGSPLRSVKRSLPSGTLPASALRARPASSLTMRISSVAVRPRMSLARAVSCTPGSCTTTRSAPCCWMIGSATPELVDAVAQDRDVLLRRAPSWISFCASGLSSRQPELGAGAVLAQREVGVAACRSRRAPCLRSASSRKRDHDVVAFARDARVLDVLFAQQRADVGAVAVGGLVERGLHVDLQQEVHAAAQVEAEIHRQRAEAREPARRRRQQVQRDDVVRRRAVSAFCSASFALICVSGSAKRTDGLMPVGVEARAAVRDARRPSARPRRARAARCRP